MSAIENLQALRAERKNVLTSFSNEIKKLEEDNRYSAEHKAKQKQEIEQRTDDAEKEFDSRVQKILQEETEKITAEADAASQVSEIQGLRIQMAEAEAKNDTRFFWTDSPKDPEVKIKTLEENVQSAIDSKDFSKAAGILSFLELIGRETNGTNLLRAQLSEKRKTPAQLKADKQLTELSSAVELIEMDRLTEMLSDPRNPRYVSQPLGMKVSMKNRLHQLQLKHAKQN